MRVSLRRGRRPSFLYNRKIFTKNIEADQLDDVMSEIIKIKKMEEEAKG